MVTTAQKTRAGGAITVSFPDENAQARRSDNRLVRARRTMSGESPPQLVDHLASSTPEAIWDFAFTDGSHGTEQDKPITHGVRHIADAMRLGESGLGGMIGIPLWVGPTSVNWASRGGVVETNALINTLALEQISISFDPTAGAILGRIYDRGHATCEDLADWLESPEEWIAFSRLQRARLLYDSGTEFTVSPFGRRLIHRILNGDSVG